MSQNESYKPREERSWEEFHTDLDIDAPLVAFSSEETDANKYSEAGTPHHPFSTAQITGSPIMTQALQLLKQQGEGANGPTSAPFITPIKRGPGRPPKRPGAIMYGVGSPTPQKVTPAPIHNPKEKLVLPKPNFRRLETFAAYEKSAGVGINYVEKTFANVGYQESDIFIQPRNLIRGGKETLEDDVESSMPMDGLTSVPSINHSNAINPRVRVEYDMDEQDERWLETINAERTAQGVDVIRPQYFEIAMTLIEKEWYAMEKRKLDVEQKCGNERC
jgi:NuA3 HAT complex component NTO1